MEKCAATKDIRENLGLFDQRSSTKIAEKAEWFLHFNLGARMEEILFYKQMACILLLFVIFYYCDDLDYLQPPQKSLSGWKRLEQQNSQIFRGRNSDIKIQ